MISLRPSQFLLLVSYLVSSLYHSEWLHFSTALFLDDWSLFFVGYSLVLVGWWTGKLISFCRPYLYDTSGRMHSLNFWRTLRSRLLQEDCSNCWPLSGWRRISLCPVLICLCSISSRVIWLHNDSQVIWRTVYNLSDLSPSVICISSEPSVLQRRDAYLLQSGWITALPQLWY